VDLKYFSSQKNFMPLLIPDEIEQFTTPGAEVFYRFLRNVAKPDESVLSGVNRISTIQELTLFNTRQKLP
jgi:hypothetical protein